MSGLVSYSVFYLAFAVLFVCTTISCSAQGGRKEYGLLDIKDTAFINDGHCVVALVDRKFVQPARYGKWQLDFSQTAGELYGLCPQVDYYTQPSLSFCTGFLVDNQHVVTAKHCLDGIELEDFFIVRRYAMDLASKKPRRILNAADVLQVATLDDAVERLEVDVAILTLDQPVAGFKPVPVAYANTIDINHPVHCIGHPLGLPSKVAFNGVVMSLTEGGNMNIEINTFAGNSGSPVFDSDTHQIIGILVEGQQDLAQAGNCKVENPCLPSNCPFEIVLSNALFQEFLEGER